MYCTFGPYKTHVSPHREGSGISAEEGAAVPKPEPGPEPDPKVVYPGVYFCAVSRGEYPFLYATPCKYSAYAYTDREVFSRRLQCTDCNLHAIYSRLLAVNCAVAYREVCMFVFVSHHSNTGHLPLSYSGNPGILYAYGVSISQRGMPTGLLVHGEGIYPVRALLKSLGGKSNPIKQSCTIWLNTVKQSCTHTLRAPPAPRPALTAQQYSSCVSIRMLGECGRLLVYMAVCR
jgi:hypothetical protein